MSILKTHVSESETLTSLFLHAVIQAPESPFLSFLSHDISYGDAARRVSSLITEFSSYGVKKDSVIATFIEKQESLIFTYLAAAFLQAKVTMLSPLFSCKYFEEHICSVFSPVLTLCTLENSSELRKCGYQVIDIHSPQSLCSDSNTWDDLFLAIENLKCRNEEVTADQILLLATTAGSSGAPKVVKRKHRAFVRYAKFVGDELVPKNESPHRFLGCASLNHAFGCHMLTTAIAYMASTCIPSEIDTGVRISEIFTLSPTVLPLVPRVQRSLYLQLQKQEFSPPTFPSAQYICSAGGKPNYDILSHFHNNGAEIVEFYGSTEASVVAVTPRGQWRKGYAGKPVEDLEFHIAKNNELLIRSPGLTPGYCDGNLEFFTEDNFFKTGDLAVVDDGYIKIYGRARDVFNSPDGSNIFPCRIEQGLELINGVRQSMLIGDQKPYLTALLAVDLSTINAVLDEQKPFSLDTSILDPIVFEELYSDIGKQITILNRSLQKIETVIRFLLIDESFSVDIYKAITAGKVRRNRRALAVRYSAVIEHLYSREVPYFSNNSFVKGSDRRLRRKRSSTQI